MSDGSDFARWVDARWPDLVGGLEDDGVAPDDARLAVAEVLLASRHGWDRRVREEQVDLAVWAALVEEVRVVVGAMARARPGGIGQADGRPSVRVHRDAVGPREGAEVMIERPVLHHDEHEMVEVHDARVGIEWPRPVGGRLQLRRPTQRPSIHALRRERGIGLAHEPGRPHHVGRLGPQGVGRLGGDRCAR